MRTPRNRVSREASSVAASHIPMVSQSEDRRTAERRDVGESRDSIDEIGRSRQDRGRVPTAGGW